MSGFHERISAERCAEIFQAAQDAGMIDEVTPSVIVHDLARMRRRIEVLNDEFPQGTLHALAIKANPLVSVLGEAVSCGMGLEAAGMEEVHLAIAAGCPAEKIVFDSPAKTVGDIREALDLGVLINANSLDELDRIEAALESKPSNSSIGLRVNPELGSGSIEHTSVASQTSKFGVLLGSSRERIVDEFVQRKWLTGLHVHIGSQGCSLQMLIDAAVLIQQLRTEIESRSGRRLAYVDIGGGMPTVYRSDQSSFSPQEYVQQLRAAAPDLMDGSVRLVTEFGRAIQAGCGVTLTRVEYVRPEQSIAVVHVGADFLLRPVYASDDWQHEFFVLSADGRVKTEPAQPLTIAGPLCFSGDIIGRDVPLPPVEEGDWLVVRDTGAYTLSMWSRHCSRSMPRVIGYDDQNSTRVRLLRESESPQSMVRFWSQSP